MSFNRKNAYLKMAQKGLLDMLPLNLAVLPWGVLCGSLAIQRDFTIFEAILMPMIVFAGSVQLVVIELISDNAPLATILFTAFIISSRHFLYGLALREKLKNLPLKWRGSLGFLLTDELFALSGERQSYKSKLRLIYALFAGGSFYFSWLAWNIIGIVAGSILPDLTHLGLDFAIAVTFIALVIPSIVNLSILVTVCVAAILSVVFKVYNLELGLVLSSVIAMYSGYFTSKMQIKSNNKSRAMLNKKEEKIL
ncbi:AzlC family ABC transporter permease [Pseudoalteromonas denitrificans]|uniref:4-azaleucine resistance probable transporter AzlC n=1 Tax=Pseudoalteromonas denitrificans DSM 6059 TaxID=1123010 RepID=A0A1I1IMU6_9GAMM|nr:AzlC family ABC transporter permease [Pseudoalteromonas denitrificans]SFC35073.1 4-azaleucine resistance probable transporter AzlC [Pseudoalteromonas denitrificans DSM 6059]